MLFYQIARLVVSELQSADILTGHGPVTWSGQVKCELYVITSYSDLYLATLISIIGHIVF